LIPPVDSKPVAVENVMVKGLVAAEPAEPSAPSAIPGPVAVSNEIVKEREPATPAEPSAPSAGPAKVEPDYVQETFKQAMATFDDPSYKKALLAVLNLIEAVDFLSTAFYCFAAHRRVWLLYYVESHTLAVYLFYGAMLTLLGTSMFTLGYHIPGLCMKVLILPGVCFLFGIVFYFGMTLLLQAFLLVVSDHGQSAARAFGVLLILLIVMHFSTLMLLVTFMKKRAARKWKAHPENEEAKEELEYASIRMQAASMEVPVLHRC